MRKLRQSEKAYPGCSQFPKESEWKEEKAGAMVPSARSYKLPRALSGRSHIRLLLNILWEKLIAVGNWEVLREICLCILFYWQFWSLNLELHASGASALPQCSSSPLERVLNWKVHRGGREEGGRQGILLGSCGNSIGER